MIVSIFVMAIIGFSVAAYIYSLEQKIKLNPTYKPACDLSDAISCTKPMKSDYANLLYFSNAIVAMFFYALIAGLALFNAVFIIIILSVIACAVSCVLAYILYFKIKAFCILCTTLYCINFILLYLSLTIHIIKN